MPSRRDKKLISLAIALFILGQQQQNITFRLAAMAILGIVDARQSDAQRARRREALLHPSVSPAALYLAQRQPMMHRLWLKVSLPVFDEMVKRLILVAPHRDPENKAVAQPGTTVKGDLAVALVLRYLTSKASEAELCREFGLEPATLEENLWKVMDEMHKALQAWPAARVQWPSAPAITSLARLMKRKHPPPPRPGGGSPRVFAFAESASMPVETPTDESMAKHYWSGYRRAHCINNLFFFAPDGCIIFYTVNYPSRFSNQQLIEQLQLKVLNRHRIPEGYTMLGGTNMYAKGMQRFIETPATKRSKFSADPEMREQQEAFSQWIVRALSAKDCGVSSLERVFQRVTIPLHHDKLKRLSLLRVIVHLHNLRARLMGENNNDDEDDDEEDEGEGISYDGDTDSDASDDGAHDDDDDEDNDDDDQDMESGLASEAGDAVSEPSIDGGEGSSASSAQS
jgi:hypothetical protein